MARRNSSRRRSRSGTGSPQAAAPSATEQASGTPTTESSAPATPSSDASQAMSISKERSDAPAAAAVSQSPQVGARAAPAAPTPASRHVAPDDGARKAERSATVAAWVQDLKRKLRSWHHPQIGYDDLFSVEERKQLAIYRRRVSAQSATIAFVSYENPFGRAGGVFAVADNQTLAMQRAGRRAIVVSPLHSRRMPPSCGSLLRARCRSGRTPFRSKSTSTFERACTGSC